MHRTLLLLSALLTAGVGSDASAQAPQAAAQTPAAKAPAALPHAWLYGAWTGGIFPPPVTLTAQECLAAPTVIFTRDAVLQASPTDVTYIQRLVETVRATGGGVEFRLARPAQSVATGGLYGLTPQAPPLDPGFGCGGPETLRVQKRGEDLIAFPNCTAFPYPLVRCPAR